MRFSLIFKSLLWYIFFFHAKETQENFKLLLNYNHIVKQTRDLERQFCIRTHLHPLSVNNGWIMEGWASLVAQVVENLPEIWEIGFNPWVWKMPCEKGMATHSSILAWRIPWTEKLGRLQSMGLQSRTRLSDYNTTINGGKWKWSRVQFFATLWTVACQASPSMGFSRQEYRAFSISRGSSWPKDWTQVSRIAGRRFTLWATRVDI